MRGEKGITLVEIMVCVGIVAIVAAIALPAFSAAKLGSKKSASKESLRQSWMALMIYRTDHGGGTDSGTASEMALPMFDVGYEFSAAPYSGPNGGRQLYWSPQTDTTDIRITGEWVRYTRACRQESILISDYAYDASDPRSGGRMDAQSEHLVLGVRLSGKLEERRGRGTPTSPLWWPCAAPTE